MSARIMNSDAPKSLSNLFNNPAQDDMCERCHNRVYYMEKIGPLGNHVVFHKQCFKCCKCNQRLTLKTYYANQVDLNDREVYCSRCTEKVHMSGGLDAQAIGIRAALSAPKARKFNQQILSKGTAPRIGADAMFITGPAAVQHQYQQKQKQDHAKHNFPAFVVQQKKEVIVKAQQNLELQHREEEAALMATLLADRHAENERIKKEMESEWENKLRELTSQYDDDMILKTSYKKNPDSKDRAKRFESEKEELKKNLTIRMKQKKEAATLRLQKKEHEETAHMVQKQSEQMLDVIRAKQEEVKMQLEQEIQEHQTDENQNSGGSGEAIDAVAVEEALAALSILPKEVPPPHPPTCRKRDLYYDAEIFRELDELVFAVAERDHVAFTDLVGELTVNCITDLEKARVIFRWITVKDLNVLAFESEAENDSDSPMGILQGIKYGTETYHTLFMRLCSYAGLACVEIKGHSKSVGYEPGMKIREDTFQNTWNAVLIDGNWWPVQCNWGARHLVLNKDVPGASSSSAKQQKGKKQDKIRYQYDEHYFLTDPDEFIQEFWAADQAWQLLERPMTLEEFEAMPFVRSVFFHYGLEFDVGLQSVLHTDSKGGTEVKIRVPQEFMQDLVFHYQIRFADRERRNDTEYRSAKLERFVFHSLVDGFALFSIHVPTAASFFLEVFANKIDDSNKLGDDPNATMMPFRLKCACKFKVVCDELVGKMHPLPNCASGEWGPSKGTRHFNLTPIGNNSGVVSFDSECTIRIKIPSALHFLCKLRMNGVDDATLESHVEHSVDSDTLHVHVHPPQPGQYGLDIYARPEDATDNHTLAHACKYLLNCKKVHEPVEINVATVEENSRMSKDKWGPMEPFEALGLSTVSHPNPTIEKLDSSKLEIELALSEPLKLSYHLIKEPNKDYRDKVTMKDGSKKVKFSMHLPMSGNYLFAIYARRKREVQMLNVYNYMIRYTDEKEAQKSLKKNGKSKSLFKR